MPQEIDQEDDEGSPPGRFGWARRLDELMQRKG
jgi:hypothetical protein